MLTVVTIARADGASSTVAAGSSNAAAAPANSANSANSASSANSSASGAADNGQTLEVPAVTPPSALAPEDSIWSDGTHTYIWKDESARGNDEGDTAMPAPDSSLPDPLYASVDDYMNQGMQDEALGPAFSPFFGAPMPFLPYGPYAFYPSPVAPPPVPPPFHYHRHRLGLMDFAPGDARAAKAPPSFGMRGFGHASRMH